MPLTAHARPTSSTSTSTSRDICTSEVKAHAKRICTIRLSHWETLGCTPSRGATMANRPRCSGTAKRTPNRIVSHGLPAESQRACTTHGLNANPAGRVHERTSRAGAVHIKSTVTYRQLLGSHQGGGGRGRVAHAISSTTHCTPATKSAHLSKWTAGAASPIPSASIPHPTEAGAGVGNLGACEWQPVHTTHAHGKAEHPHNV